jgi:DNA-binding XRE family transcriptional regulator
MSAQSIGTDPTAPRQQWLTRKVQKAASDGPPQHLGALVKGLREHKKLSQGDLAKAADVAKQAISNVESGTVVPTLPTLAAIGNILEITMKSSSPRDVSAVSGVSRPLVRGPPDHRPTASTTLRPQLPPHW